MLSSTSSISSVPGSLGRGCLLVQWRGPKIAQQKHLIRTWKVRVGDMVEIISGKDKGTQGEILQTDYRRNMVKVRGANLRRMKDKDGNDYQIEKKI
ncbi:hypothetical protein FOZ62_014235, partial [Perkinsus olseni]